MLLRQCERPALGSLPAGEVARKTADGFPLRIEAVRGRPEIKFVGRLRNRGPDCDRSDRFRDFPMELMMEYATGRTQVFAVAENVGSYQIHVIDPSDPSGPILLGSSQPQQLGSVSSVAASHPYVSIAGKQLSVFDASQPQSLELASSFAGGGIGRMRGLDVVGSMVYIARSMHSDASYLRLVDFSDPKTPVKVGSCRTSGGAKMWQC